MSLFQNIQNMLLRDFLTIYRIMPAFIRRKILLVFLLMLVIAIFEALSILSLSFLALSVASPDKTMSLPLVRYAFDIFPSLHSLQSDVRIFAFWVALLVAGLTIVKNAMSALAGMRTAMLGEAVAQYAGETLFRYFLNSSYLDFLSGKTRQIPQVFSWRSQLGFFLVNLMQVYTYIVISIALFLILISATPEVLLATLVVVTSLCFFIYKRIKQSVDAAGKESAECSSMEYLALENAKRGMMEVHIYRQQPYFFEAYRSAGMKAMQSRALITVAPPIPTWILESIAFLVIPAALWIMISFYDASMSRITGVLTMIMLASWRVLPLLNRSMTNMVALRGAHYPALQCAGLIDEIQKAPIPPAVEAEQRLEFSEAISFEDVSFFYPSSEKAALRHVTFRLAKGERLGIVGQSGAGKSSLANILSGLIEPTAGRMLVDGNPLSPSERAAYMLGVGYVAQNPYVAPGTLAQNVAFSQWGRPYDEERVRQACRMAHLDIADQRPEGINLPIGEGGSGLSGGQLQRLSIARALYASPHLLILDEATSSLDMGVEAAIMKTITSLPRAMTLAIIAHRLSTVESCDSILWLRDGETAMYGPPSEVLPHYREYLRASHERTLPQA